jgi:chromosome segregation ATPase
MSDKIELGEPDAIRNEDNILWLRAEIERLTGEVDSYRTDYEECYNDLLSETLRANTAEAEIERLEADAENLRNTITSMHLSLKERDAEIDRLRAALENDSG